MYYFARILFKEIPQLASVLGKTHAQQLLLIFSLWWFVGTRKLGLIKSFKEFSFHFNHKDFKFTLFRPMDIAVLREIYLDQEYDWCPIENPKVIIDLGAHIGDTSMYYHVQFPNARIIAVEPSPENYNRLLTNVAGVSKITPVQAAVGRSDGAILLYEGVSALGHSTVANASKSEGVSVPLQTLETLLKINNIFKADLIKFDIEGAEFDLFEDFRPEEFAHAYIGELHFDLSDITKEEFACLFTNFKTEWIEIRPQRYMFRACYNIIYNETCSNY